MRKFADRIKGDEQMTMPQGHPEDMDDDEEDGFRGNI